MLSILLIESQYFSKKIIIFKKDNSGITNE